MTVVAWAQSLNAQSRLPDGRVRFLMSSTVLNFHKKFLDFLGIWLFCQLTMKGTRNLHAQAQVFKALGQPARLCMVEALADGERCVCDLTALVGLDMSTTSKHLAVLAAAGVVTSDKRGNKVFYQLRTPCLLKVLDCLGEAQKAGDEPGRGCCE
jgi:DNA-binding transcriptional ArsR family regulator